MEEKKSYRAIFKEKMAEVHTHEEILQVFDGSFCACFALKEEHTPGARMTLLGKIWDINPDAIIVEADLFVAHTNPEAARGQYLVLCKNGTKESNALVCQLLEESGSITDPWYFQSGKESGFKSCFRYKLGTELHAVLYKANLIFDGDNPLLTVRSLSTADRERL